MSEHGRLSGSDTMPPGLRTPEDVSRHRGSAADFLHRHQQHAKRVLQRGKAGLLEIVPHLLHRISDERTLSLAFDYLADNGGQAPGPDGLRYTDFTTPKQWAFCRDLRDEIRSGQFTSGEEYLRQIPKRSGNGKRPLIIQDIDARIVQRATVMILQPLLDPRFDPRSFGFRPGRSILDALALAERLTLRERRWVWVAVDIRDAFTNVPLPRLRDIVRKALVDEELVRFIAGLLAGSRWRGLRQGGPLSPLLLNLYLHHFLDRKWRKMCPHIPLIRYADDILLLCLCEEEASQAYNALVEMLTPVGMTLKEDQESAICQLAQGDAARYMGFEIRKDEDRLRLGLTREAWDGLRDALADCHEAPASAWRAVQVVAGWLDSRAACLSDLGVDNVYARVQKIAKSLDFEELLDPSDVDWVAEQAIRRWQQARRNARFKPAH